MASMTDSDKAISLTSPPQLRVVGFTTSSAIGEESSESCSTTSHSLPESPLSRLLRSATWPTLRVRLCKTEIPAGLPSGSECSVHNTHSEQDDSVIRHGRSSSPISIPREYRYVSVPQAADREHFEYRHCSACMTGKCPLNDLLLCSCSMKQGTKSTSDAPYLKLSLEAAEFVRGQTEQPSSPPMCCSALSVYSSHCDMDFAAACWGLD